MAEFGTRGINQKVSNINGGKGIWHIPEDDEIDADQPQIHYPPFARPSKPVESFGKLNLSTAILKGLHQMNIFKPNNIQRYFLPHYFLNKKEREVIVMHAPRNTGKTTSALIAVLNDLSFLHANSSKAIMMYPTIESANKAVNLGKTLAKFTKLSFYLSIQKCKQKICEEIIVATPQKIASMLNKKQFDIQDIKVIIVDDIVILDQSHRNILRDIFSRIQPFCELILLTSVPSKKYPSDSISSITGRTYRAITIEFSTVQNISFVFIPCFMACSDYNAKKESLLHIIRERYSMPFQIAVICEHRVTVQDLHCYLEDNKFSVSFVTAKIPLAEQLTILKGFKAGIIKVLIATRAFADLKTSQLMTLIHFDHFLDEDETTVKLDLRCYQTWMNNLLNSEHSLNINFVDDRYERYVLKKPHDENIEVIDEDALATKLLRMKQRLNLAVAH